MKTAYLYQAASVVKFALSDDLDCFLSLQKLATQTYFTFAVIHTWDLFHRELICFLIPWKQNLKQIKIIWIQNYENASDC